MNLFKNWYQSRLSAAKVFLIKHEIKLAVFSIATALLFSVFAFSLVFGNLNENVQWKNLQINSLIQELGVLQEDNLILTHEVSEKDREFDFLVSRFSRLTTTIEGLEETTEDFENMKRALYDAELSLNEQTGKIEALSNVNHTLLRAVGYEEYPSDILDILILGTHGSLTDTIMLASVNPNLETMTFLSIPRDLYLSGRKINEMFNRYGIQKLKENIRDVTGIMPDKYIVVDLEAFVSFIDALGGIDVYIEQDIEDLTYPGPDYSYTTFSISKGQHTLDGDMALKYARSRHSTSDFDRSKRQQQILDAVLKKVKTLDILSRLEESINILQTLNEKIDTDIDVFEALGYFKKFQNYLPEQGNVLSTSNYLYSTVNQRGQYILLPSHGNYSAIHSYAAKLIKE